MCAYIYIYIYIYICICICIYIYICVCVCACLYILYIYICVCVCAFIYLEIYTPPIHVQHRGYQIWNLSTVAANWSSRQAAQAPEPSEDSEDAKLSVRCPKFRMGFFFPLAFDGMGWKWLVSVLLQKFSLQFRQKRWTWMDLNGATEMLHYLGLVWCTFRSPGEKACMTKSTAIYGKNGG